MEKNKKLDPPQSRQLEAIESTPALEKFLIYLHDLEDWSKELEEVRRTNQQKNAVLLPARYDMDSTLWRGIVNFEEASFAYSSFELTQAIALLLKLIREIVKASNRPQLGRLPFTQEEIYKF